MTNIIDELGYLKAQISALTAKEKALKDELIARGVGAYDGDDFRVTVSVAEVERLDLEAAREKLSPQFIRAHTITSTRTTVKVVARVRAAA